MTDKERLEEIKKLRETILEENDFRTRCVLAYVLHKQNKRYREILNASRGIIKDAIYALDNNKKVQGLEFAVKIINRALEGEE